MLQRGPLHAPIVEAHKQAAFKLGPAFKEQFNDALYYLRPNETGVRPVDLIERIESRLVEGECSYSAVSKLVDGINAHEPLTDFQIFEILQKAVEPHLDKMPELSECLDRIAAEVGSTAVFALNHARRGDQQGQSADVGKPVPIAA